MATIEILGTAREVYRTTLEQHEVAFLLRCVTREIRNRLRRGERMLAKGVAPEEIVSAGALIPSRSGGRRRVDLQSLLPALGGDRLAVEAAVAIANGYYVVPRPQSIDSPPPDLAEALMLIN